MGSLGPGAWFPASSTSTLGTHFTLKSQPGTGTHSWEGVPQGPAPARASWLRKSQCFLPYSSAKITLPWKNKKTKHPPPNTPSHPNPKQPDNHSVKEQRAPNLTALDRRQERSHAEVCLGNCKDMELKVRAGYKVI